MEKTKRYPLTKFSSRIVRQAVDACRLLAPNDQEHTTRCNVTVNDETWKFDSIDEFLISYADKAVNGATLQMFWSKSEVSFYFNLWDETTVAVQSKSCSSIESILSLFEEASGTDRIISPNKPRIIIFIGHGHSDQWQKLKAHLQDQHKLEVQAYETGARAGHTIRDIASCLFSKRDGHRDTWDMGISGLKGPPP
jgi:hypothetical protein